MMVDKSLREKRLSVRQVALATVSASLCAWLLCLGTGGQAKARGRKGGDSQRSVVVREHFNCLVNIARACNDELFCCCCCHCFPITPDAEKTL